MAQGLPLQAVESVKAKRWFVGSCVVGMLGVVVVVVLLATQLRAAPAAAVPVPNSGTAAAAGPALNSGAAQTAEIVDSSNGNGGRRAPAAGTQPVRAARKGAPMSSSVLLFYLSELYPHYGQPISQCSQLLRRAKQEGSNRCIVCVPRALFVGVHAAFALRNVHACRFVRVCIVFNVFSKTDSLEPRLHWSGLAYARHSSSATCLKPAMAHGPGPCRHCRDHQGVIDLCCAAYLAL